MENKQRKFLKIIYKETVKASKIAARIDANTACPFFGYQEEEPKVVKKLRKF